MWWQPLIGVVAGARLLYVGFMGLLGLAYRRDSDVDALRAGLRFLPDLVRLVRSLGLSIRPFRAAYDSSCCCSPATSSPRST